MYLALYEDRGAVAAMTLHETLSYAWVTQSLISIGAGWISWDLEQSIRSGDIITDLARPWNFYAFWLSRTLGERLFNLLLRGSLTYLIGVLYFGARLPSPVELAAFLVAALLAMLVSAAFGFLINVTAFWLVDISGLMLVANLVMGFFSGFLLPVAFFPPALATLVHLLPFQAIASVPARVFLGQLQGVELAAALALQAGWAILLTGAALLALRIVMRKIVIQGG